jgi:hypothetical protein
MKEISFILIIIQKIKWISYVREDRKARNSNISGPSPPAVNDHASINWGRANCPKGKRPKSKISNSKIPIRKIPKKMNLEMQNLD